MKEILVIEGNFVILIENLDAVTNDTKGDPHK